MKKNVGGYDRIARLVLGPVLIVVGAGSLLGYLLPATTALATVLAVVAVLVGLVFLVTGTVQKCPLNSLIGLNTFRGDRTDGPDEVAESTGGRSGGQTN